MIIKALTLHQPWATQVALGRKEIETRNWKTNYRGPLAIHAAKRPVEKDLHPSLYKNNQDRNIIDFPLGCVLAVVKLVDLHEITPDFSSRFVSTSEWVMGNFNTKYEPRYAWMLKDVKPLANPVFVRGNQGLWNFHWKGGYVGN